MRFSKKLKMKMIKTNNFHSREKLIQALCRESINLSNNASKICFTNL